MATVLVGHQLYLYRLFVSKVGVGRQVALSHMEEVLASDDIMPCDLGFNTTRELLEHLDSFIRLTVFKKGRVYATVLAQPNWDETLLNVQKDDETKHLANKGAKSWKRKKNKGVPQPLRPRPRNRPAPELAVMEPAATEAEAEPVAAVEAEPEAEPVAAASQELLAARDSAKPVAAPVAQEPVGAAGPEPVAEPEAEPVAATEPVVATEPVDAPVAAVEAEPRPEPVAEPEVEPEPATTIDAMPGSLEAKPTVTSSQQAHPHDFAEQVHIGNELLSDIYAMLPLDVDPIALLDEDWRVARSTSSYSQKDGVVTFPLRYLHAADGKPVEVSMRRGSPVASGKRWVVTNICGEKNVGFDGLPTSGSGAMRELAQFAALGPWDDLVCKLNKLRAPGCGPTNNEELQEYLSVTFHRVRMENKLATYGDGAMLAFDTGLLTPDAQSVFMCFAPYAAGEQAHGDSTATHPGDMAWRFEAFCTEQDMGMRGPMPEPALYITSLSHLIVRSETSVRIKKDLLRAHGKRLEAAVRVAIRRVRRDYRLGTPAYDPVKNRLHLLVPLCLDNLANADHALVLVPDDEREAGAEQCVVASAVLSLERAAACARVVSLELPRWLEPR